MLITYLLQNEFARYIIMRPSTSEVSLRQKMMSIISVRENENNRRKRKGKSVDKIKKKVWDKLQWKCES